LAFYLRWCRHHRSFAVSGRSTALKKNDGTARTL
jgi:hypothetical protein